MATTLLKFGRIVIREVVVMAYCLRLIALVVCVLSCEARVAAAQIQFALLFEDFDGIEPHRVFADTSELRLTVSVQNDFEIAVWIAHANVKAALTLAVDQEGEDVLFEQEWEPRVGLSGKGMVSTIPEEQLLIEPGGYAAWTLTLRRADGRIWTTGTYKVSVKLEPIQGAQTSDGSAITVRAVEGRRGLVIAPPRSSRELASMHSARGRRALLAGELSPALEAFREAGRANPEDFGARLSAGGVLVRLGRYTEAVLALEQIPELHYNFRVILAEAYVGLGNEGAAELVLRGGGIDNEEVSRELERLREYVRTRAC